MKRLNLLLAFFLLMAFDTRAQVSELADDDPDAVANSKTNIQTNGGGLTHTDLFTGTAGVNIPIYGYSIADLDLGISLSYASTGIKVDDVPSQVGLGWQLDGVPSIQRIANGLEDEAWVYKDDNNQIGGTWIWSDIHDHFPKDRNHDIFVLDFGGRRLKFSVDLTGSLSGTDTKKIGTFPRAEIDVRLYYQTGFADHAINWARNNSSYDPRLYNFVVIDEKGNTLYFDKVDYTEKKMEWKDGSTTSYNAITKWSLSKIKTYTGHWIYYKYDERDVNYASYHDERVSESLPNEVAWDRWCAVPPKFVKSEDVFFNGKMQFLSEIVYPNGSKLSVVNGSTYRKEINTLPVLDKINVTSGYGNNFLNTISFKFNQDYFYAQGNTPNRSLTNTTDGNALDYRLRLNSIDRVVNNGPSERYYSFEYDNTRLPARLSPSQDYYGYYNGKTPVPLPSSWVTNNTGNILQFSIPLHNLTYSNQSSCGNNIPSSLNVTYGTDKTPDINYLKAGSLKKIKNALGGEIEFFYEAHTGLLSPPNPNTYCATIETGTNSYDGLRIQKIEYQDGVTVDNKTVTKYTYEDGYRFYQKLYYWVPTGYPNPMVPARGNLNFVEQDPIVQKKWFTQFVNSVDFYNGSNHGYSTVTVTEEGYNNSILSKTKYTFSNIVNVEANTGLGIGASKLTEDKRFSSQITSPAFFRLHEIGLLLKKESYLNNGVIDLLITKVENEYITSQIASATVPNYSRTNHQRQSYFVVNIFDDITITSPKYVPSYTNPPFTNNAYLFPSYKRLLNKSTTTTYSGNTQIQQILEYEYDDRDNVSKVKWCDSKGDCYYKQYMYRYTHQQHLEGAEIFKEMGVTDIKVSGLRKIYLNISETNTLYNWQLIKTSANATGTVAQKEKNIAWDDKFNPIETEYDDGVIYSSQIWDTILNSRIAVINNARFEDVAYTSFEGINVGRTLGYYDKGNWNFDASKVYLGSALPGTNPGHAMTGLFCYELTNNSTTNIMRTINGDKYYYLSFWTDKNAQVYVDGSMLTGQVAQTANGYKLMVYNISPLLGPSSLRTLIISNNTPFPTFIDELRLHPSNAQMETYTYNPLFGVTSTCDQANNIKFTEYDENGRQWRVKDVYGNIISQVDKITQGPKW